MKLEYQVCTLEQAKRLKELGVSQNSLFYHIFNTVPEIGYEGCKMRENPKDGGVVKYYSAFTTAELGEILPYRVHDEEKRENPHLRIYRGETEWHAEYHQVFSRPYVRSYAYENLSDAMAHILIHLLEKNIVTIEEVNQRLLSK